MKMEIKQFILLLFMLPKMVFGQNNHSFQDIREGHIRNNKQSEMSVKEDIQEQTRKVSNEITIYESNIDTNRFETTIYHYKPTSQNNISTSSAIPSSNKIYHYYNDNEHELTITNIINVMNEIGISNQLFVLAQAIVETGHFKSRVCREYHNLFGLRNPRTHSYYRYQRWEDSVIAYKKLVQYKYLGGNYLMFLKYIGYAEDPHYIKTVAKVARQLYEQLKAEGRL